MPQPMSTPTAAGMIAPFGRDDRADGGADADVRVGHQRDVAATNGSRAARAACSIVPGSMSLAQETRFGATSRGTVLSHPVYVRP